ncbi:SDR family NAD(P)-dependent oxidoreductase, partial [Streptomyces sp. NPDC002851]
AGMATGEGAYEGAQRAPVPAAEGVGVVLLERLSDARRNNHRVYAVLRGTAVNQDGASNGLTAPNGPSQQRVITQALEDARLRARDVDAVEGHGTGTTLGDPIEIDALQAVYGQDRPAGRPLRLGSLKSNIGHSQAAAGIGGLIKMVQALRHQVLPRTLHVDRPTDKANWSGGGVRLLTEARPWPRTGDRARRAGVSAFGVGGTNAHVIVEEAPEEARPGPVPEPTGPTGPTGPVPWLLSAKSPAALRAQAERLHKELTARGELAPVRVGAALALTRARFEHRAAVTGSTLDELLSGLRALVRGESDDTTRGTSDSGGTARTTRTARTTIGQARTGRTVFVFPGQGSQWLGMGRELAAAHPVFAAELKACADALAPHTDWSLDDVLRGAPDAPPLDRVDVVQPALFAVMVSLAALWRHHGVHPDAVIGHSQGEIAAAYVAGGLSLEDAARIVALRSREIAAMAGGGGMVSVTATPERLRPILEPLAERISVAAVNGPASTVVSGDSDALAELLEACARDDIWARRIPVDYASHSPHVEQLRERLTEVLAPVAPRTGAIRFHSTVTAAEFDTAGLDAGYWHRNLRRPVRFEETVRGLLDSGCTAFVEISPHPVLTVAVEQIVEQIPAALVGPGGVPPAVIGSLERGDDVRRFTAALAEADTRGVPVAWDTVFDAADARGVELPTYPFQTRRYWPAPRPDTGIGTGSGLRPTGHPLLTAQTELADGEGRLFTGRLDRQTHAWLDDHAVYGTVLVPGTAFVDLAALAAAHTGCGTVEELTLQEPLALGAEDRVDVQLTVRAMGEGGRYGFSVHSRPAEDGDPQAAHDGQWTCHATGSLAPAPTVQTSPQPSPVNAPFPYASWPPPESTPLDLGGLYDRLGERGFGYGPGFRGLRAAWRHGDSVLAEVELPETVDRAGFGIHPALLDAAFHARLTELTGPRGGPDTAWLPFTWSGVRLAQSGSTRLRVRLSTLGEGTFRMTATDERGTPVVSVDSVVARPVDPSALASARTVGDSLYRLEWTAVPDPAAAAAPSTWAVLGGDGHGLPDAKTHQGLPDAKTYPDLIALTQALDAGAPVPDAVLVPGPAAGGVLDAETIRARARQDLELLRSWLADERLAAARLVFLSRWTVATEADAVADPAMAPLWGLVRSAQSEHPGRFVLVDLENSGTELLPAALATGEPQLAVRDGVLYAPRLVRARDAGGGPLAFDPDGTVLITGGTSGIGSWTARHLVATHGARHLLLVSRQGRAAAGAAELERELTALGAEITVAACDAADPEEMKALLESVPAAHPLTAVIHSAGVLDDGLIESLTPERLDRVLRPKVDAALLLHRLTEDLPLSSFVLYSSVAGTFGGPAQGNYAAANTFLDTLAQWRRAQGLPAVSLAWGLWEQESDMTRHLGGADVARLGRSGLAPLATEEGLRLFDAVHGAGPALLVPARLDLGMLRAQARESTLPAVLRSLVPAAGPAQAPGEDLAARLTALDEEQREALLLETVLAKAATVLGFESADAVDPGLPFKDLGLDSLGAVRLRNLLSRATGLALPSTLVFSHPTAADLSGHLRSLLPSSGLPSRDPDREDVRTAADDVRTTAGVLAELDRIAAQLPSIAEAESAESADIGERLRSLLALLGDDGTGPGAGTDGLADRIGSATAEEVFDLIDNDLGVR